MEGGPPGFIPDFTCPALLGCRPRRRRRFAYGALTVSGRPFQAVPLRRRFVTASQVWSPVKGRSHNTSCSNASRLAHAWVWAGPISLATTLGISVDFSSSAYLDVSVRRVVSFPPMCSAGGGRPLRRPGCPIRRSAGQRVCAPHRGLSQLATSFIDFLCQGIHRMLFKSSFSHILNW